MIVNLNKTWDKNQKQWEGQLDDGRMIYARYINGRLIINRSANPTSIVNDAFLYGEIVYNETVDEEINFEKKITNLFKSGEIYEA